MILLKNIITVMYYEKCNCISLEKGTNSSILLSSKYLAPEEKNDILYVSKHHLSVCELQCYYKG